MLGERKLWMCQDQFSSVCPCKILWINLRVMSYVFISSVLIAFAVVKLILSIHIFSADIIIFQKSYSMMSWLFYQKSLIILHTAMSSHRTLNVLMYLHHLCCVLWTWKYYNLCWQKSQLWDISMSP